MARTKFANFGEYFFWCYSSMQMLMVALKRGQREYDRGCYAIREKYFKGYREGRYAPSSLVGNALARSASGCCWYCGSEEALTRDHILPLSKGAPDCADNIALACRRCNSSKGNSDLIEWFRDAFDCPAPLGLWASYLKLVYQFSVSNGLMEMHRPEMEAMNLPFSLTSLSYQFPISDFDYLYDE